MVRDLRLWVKNVGSSDKDGRRTEDEEARCQSFYRSPSFDSTYTLNVTYERGKVPSNQIEPITGYGKFIDYLSSQFILWSMNQSLSGIQRCTCKIYFYVHITPMDLSKIS